VAKHRKPKNRRAPSARRTDQNRQPPSLVLLGTTATAAALSTVLVFGYATNNTVDSPQVQLAAATIGIGGRGDPDAVNILNKLQGKVVPPKYSYIPVQYPAGYDVDNSVAAGVPVLEDAIEDNSDQDWLLVVGYSEGALVAEEVRRDLEPGVDGAPSTGVLRFVMIASPNVPNGGLAARVPTGFGIPFIITSNGPAEPSPYDTTYVTDEYDPAADFPAYFNPLSLANSIVAARYVHPDQYYDSVDYDPLTGATNDPNIIVTTIDDNGVGGTDTYVFVTADHLPLFAPVREIAAVVQLTPFTEPVLGSIEPLVRLIVDMGYTDRENLNPQDHVQFSFITPPERILETVAGVPGALGQGVTNLVTGVESIPSSIPSPLSSTNSPSINERSLPKDPQQSLLTADPTPARTTDPAPEQEPPDSVKSTTEPPTAGLQHSGPKLGEVIEDGHKATPTTPGTTTPPKKNPLTQLADSVQGFFSPKKPAPSTPGSDPADSTPKDSTPQESTTNAA
jgi:diacyltrehalose acyltransferase